MTDTLAMPSRRDDVMAGFATTATILTAVFPFALILGASAIEAGLSPLEVAIMSMTIFAGASQFLLVDLWTNPPAVAALVFSVFLVNLRHVLMGFAFAPAMASFPPALRWLGLFFMVDETWALALKRFKERGVLTPTYYLSTGFSLWVGWTTLTTVGALVGSLIEDPEQFAFDFAPAAIFLCLMRGLWQGPRIGVTWLVAILVAAGSSLLVPSPWHILVGTASGVGMGALLWRPADDTQAEETGS